MMRRPLRILIIEDSEDDTQLVLRELQRGGYELEFERVETAEGMQSALAQKTWDLILCDYTLPRFGGMQALETLKASGQDIPFILISGTISEETAVTALKAGAHDFILQGRMARLIPAIQRELQDAEVRHAHKLALDTLQQSEERYRLLFENMLDGFALHEMIFDENGKPVDYRFLGVNPAFEALTGLRAKDVLNRTVLEVLPGLEYSWIERYGRVALTGEPVHFDSYSAVLDKHFEVTAFRPAPGQFAVIFVDVTERKRMEEALRASQNMFQGLFDSSPDAIVVTSREGQILRVNAQAEALFGYRADELVGQPVEILLPESFRERHSQHRAEYITDLHQRPMGIGLQLYGHRKDGSEFPVDINLGALETEAGPVVVATVRDITDRKQAELRIQHLTRLYATLSQVNQTIVRVKDQSELLQAICKVSVDYGKFGLAWIGLLNRKTGQLTPVAVHGMVQGQLPFQVINVKHAPFKNGLIGCAVEKGRVVYSQDIQTDPNMQHWRELTVAGDFHSAAAIPFCLNGEIFGLLNVYATEVDFFADQEQHNLLEEMGLDISFALETIERETRRQQAEESLRSSEDRYRDLVNNSQDLICTHDLEGRILSVNPYAEQVLGYPTGSLLQMNLRDVLTPDAQKYFGSYLSDVRKHGIAEGTMLVQTAKGETRIWQYRNTLRTEGVAVPIVRGMARDITEQRQAEEALRQSEKNYRAIVENTIVGVYQTTLRGDVLYVNEALARILEFETPDELIAQGVIARYADPKDREIMLNILREEGHISAMDLNLLTRDGKVKNVLLSASLDGEILTGMITDVTERRQAEEAFRQTSRLLQSIVSAAPLAIITYDPDGLVLSWNAAATRMFGWDEQEVIGQLPPYVPQEAFAEFHALRAQTIQGNSLTGMELRRQRKDGTLVDINLNTAPLYDNTGQISDYIAIIEDITRRKQTEEKLRHSEDRYRLATKATNDVIWEWDPQAHQLLWTENAQHVFGYSPEEIGPRETWWDEHIHPDDRERVVSRLNTLIAGNKSIWLEEYRFLRKDGSYAYISDHAFIERDADGAPLRMIGAMSDITKRKQAEEALREKERLLSESQRIGHIGSWRYDIFRDELRYSDEMYRLLDVSPQEFQHTSEAFLELIYSSDRDMVAKWMEDIRAGTQASELEFIIFRKNSDLRYIRCRGAVEFDLSGQPARFIGTAQDVTERKLAEIQIRQQIDRLTALREVDQAISSSFNLKVTLDILISHMTSKLQVDAADVLLLEPNEQTLSYAAGKGFHTNAIESTRLRMGDCQAVRERRLIHMENLENKPDPRLLTPLGAGEGFVCYFGVPLLVKGKVKGVLEIFHRAPLHPYADWLDFLNTLAGQAAIAIENTQLFENLEQSNIELSQAYDATIEGWSRALDLRDKETEGHTQRVTEMTLELARAFGLPEEQLLHIRRGCLLHDIGKMGVPDYILLKASELTEEEWVRMRSHPEYAYNLLKPIHFLAPALDIPYCHHERWDGTGYPRGLKGQEIPLSARVFAVVDVWDALRSDRPYRPAWNVERVREYVRSQAGSHFDPQVVERFLEFIKE